MFYLQVPDTMKDNPCWILHCTVLIVKLKWRDGGNIWPTLYRLGSSSGCHVFECCPSRTITMNSIFTQFFTQSTYGCSTKPDNNSLNAANYDKVISSYMICFFGQLTSFVPISNLKVPRCPLSFVRSSHILVNTFVHEYIVHHDPDNSFDF